MEDLSKEELRRCIEALERIAAEPTHLTALSDEERVRLYMAAGKVIYPERALMRRKLKAKRSEKKRIEETHDRSLRSQTAIRAARTHSVFIPPPKRITAQEATSEVGELQRPRDCYICKATFTQVHFFYDAMCPSCAAFNYEKRHQTAPLDGQVAIITGARLKIGYQAALMMLRAGAQVVVTTRFPKDAAMRFARESDFFSWSERIQVYGLDLRHSPSVEAFTLRMSQTLGRLDLLINNAAQTVRRPPGFYAHLMQLETAPLHELPAGARMLLRGHEEFRATLLGDTQALQWISELREEKVYPLLGLTDSAQLSQVPSRSDEKNQAELFPEGKLDQDLQQVDERKMNSWRMTLADVPAPEMLEVQLINSVAPFILCSKLKPLMMRHRTDAKHIVNVSAMEGKFSRHTKTDKHPHTNMAKAALNMMTLTSARDYAQSGIYMNAVDTGWVTDEDPADLSKRKQADHDFQPPLDIVDGAARVCDPFFSGILTGNHAWGNFLKDYVPTDW